MEILEHRTLRKGGLIMNIMGNFFASIAMEAVPDPGDPPPIPGEDKEDAKDKNNDISLNTDNILADDDETESNTDNDDTQNNEEGNENNTDDITDEGDADTEENISESEGSTEEDPFVKSRKQKLWGQYKKFYEIVNNAIELMKQYVPNEVTPEVIHMTTSVKDNLNEVKETVYTILTEKFQQMELTELMQQFIGLNNIYDLSVKRIETYFKNKISDKKN